MIPPNPTRSTRKIFPMHAINTLTIALTICGGLVASACSDDDESSSEIQESIESSESLEGSNESVLNSDESDAVESAAEQGNLAILESALNGLYVEANPAVLDQFWIEDFAQHNPTGPNGTAFMQDLFIDNRPKGFLVEHGLFMADGDFVAVHSRVSGFGDPLIAFDIYKMLDGRIIAHWDSIQAEVPASETVTGNSMLTTGDSYAPVSEEQERSNAETVRQSLVRLVEDGDVTAIDELFAEDYIQHSPDSPNGRDALRDLVLGFAAAPESFVYEIGFVMADGPFVAVQSRFAGEGESATIALDLYRLEEGILVEHWDVLQDEVPTEDTVSGNAMFPVQ